VLIQKEQDQRQTTETERKQNGNGIEEAVEAAEFGAPSKQ
jgi:hypothetical protein